MKQKPKYVYHGSQYRMDFENGSEEHDPAPETAEEAFQKRVELEALEVVENSPGADAELQGVGLRVDCLVRQVCAEAAEYRRMKVAPL